MHPFLAKTAATLMAIVIATTASLCRCATSACDSSRRSASVQQPQEPAACPNHCSDDNPASPVPDAPARCTNCDAPATATEPKAPPAATSMELQPFLTPALDVISMPPASSRSLNLNPGPLDPPIDVLLQSCILLI